MKNTLKWILGFFLTLLGIVVSFTTPEIRDFLGLVDKEYGSAAQTPVEGRVPGSKNTAQVKPVEPIDVRILDEETGNSNLRLEAFIKGIITDLGYSSAKITGSASVEFTANKTVSGQIRATMILNIKLNNTNLVLPALYGRGDTKKQAINHAFRQNRENIANEIRSHK